MDDMVLKVIKLFNGTIVSEGEVSMGFDQLKGYKPESPKEGGDFEAFKYEGPATIEKSVISTNENVDTEFYPRGCTQIEIAAVVLDGEYAGRKLFKRFNLDDEKQDKNGKTSLMKLADQFWAVGLEFDSLDTLRMANEKFAGMTVNVKAWAADFKDGRGKQQMWNVKSKANGVVKTGDTKPKF